MSLLKSFYCLRNTSVMNHRSLFFFFKSVPEQGSGVSVPERKKKICLFCLCIMSSLGACSLLLEPVKVLFLGGLLSLVAEDSATLEDGLLLRRQAGVLASSSRPPASSSTFTTSRCPFCALMYKRLTPLSAVHRCRNATRSAVHESGDTTSLTTSRHLLSTLQISLCRPLVRLPPNAAFFEAIFW